MSYIIRAVSRYVILLLLPLILMLGLVACNNSQPPEEAAQEWFNYLNSMSTLKAIDMTCVDEQENLIAATDSGSAFHLLDEPPTTNTRISVDNALDGISFVTTTPVPADGFVDSSVAEVSVKGTLSGTVNGVAKTAVIDEVWQMRAYMGGDNNLAWKWCGILDASEGGEIN